MNLPNKLTVARVIAVPVFMAVLLIEILLPDAYIVTRTIAGLLFIAAAVTDFIDGRIARKYNLVTDFGKFLDPIADKLLVLSALICFTRLNMMLLSVWITVIILLRELVVTGLRLVVRTGAGHVVTASIWGKLKTVFQMVAIGAFLLQDAVGALVDFPLAIGIVTLGDVIMWVAIAMTVISGIDYIKQYAKYINPKE